MHLPWRRSRRHPSRGQSLVEFALILPILVLLMLLALDFGRVFFGWVALNNAARIAANDAGANPDAWDGVGSKTVEASKRAKYRLEVLQDMSGINCAPGGGGTWATSDVPDPVFTNVVNTASPYEPGDHAAVALTCHFSFLTPLVGGILGDPMPISAFAEFPVTAGLVAGVPDNAGSSPPEEAGDCVAPQLFGARANTGATEYVTAGFTGSFVITEPPNGNYLIMSQSLVAGGFYDCATSMTVFGS